MGGDVPAPLQDVRPRVPSLPAVDQPFIDLDQAIGLEPLGKGLMGSLIRYPYDKKGRSAPPVRDARHRALQVGASGRGEVRAFEQGANVLATLFATQLINTRGDSVAFADRKGSGKSK